MMKDLLGKEINIGDKVILQLSISGNKRFSTTEFVIGKVVEFTEKMVVLQFKKIVEGDFESNMLDDNYEEKLVKRYPNSIIVYSE